MVLFVPPNRRRHPAPQPGGARPRRYLEHRTPAGEVVEIPWLEGYPLEGYFLSAPNTSSRSPVVICIGEPGHRKEEYLYRMARYAGARGIALLALDLLGPGNGAQFDEIVGRADLETALSHIMDYLITRDDVDRGRIAILGDSSSSFVARGVALDHRFAAAVCDGGIWDLHERQFLTKRMQSREADAFSGMDHGRASSAPKCPVLITIGEQGWLEGHPFSEPFAPKKNGP